MPRDLRTPSPRRYTPRTLLLASRIQVSISDEMVESVSVVPGVRLVSIAVMFSVFR
jgi:hypothetical protein